MAVAALRDLAGAPGACGSVGEQRGRGMGVGEPLLPFCCGRRKEEPREGRREDGELSGREWLLRWSFNAGRWHRRDLAEQ